MTIISREKGRVKQYQYRVYFTDVFGNRKQRNSNEHCRPFCEVR